MNRVDLKKFEAQLQKSLRKIDERPKGKVREALGVLRSMASVVQGFLYGAGVASSLNGRVDVRLGGLSEGAFDYRVEARSQDAVNFLVQVSIPLAGYPVMFDRLDGDPATKCESKAQLEKALVALTQDPYFQAGLVGLRECSLPTEVSR